MQSKILRAFMRIILCSAIFLVPEISQAASFKAVLPLSRIKTVTVNGKTITCALFHGRSKWLVAKRITGSVYKSKKGTRAQKAACNSTDSVGSVSLAEIPNTEDLFRANSSNQAIISSVTGTPPALPEIPSQVVKNLFWRTGVVDGVASGSPTADQCSELFDSPIDGTSSGFNGCYMTMNAGESFETVLRSGTNLCYMKHALTADGLSQGLLSLVSGTFPGGSVDNLVTPPTGSTARIIRIGAGGLSIYFRIYGTTTNATNGDSYRFDFWSCDNGDNAAPSEIESTRITTDGIYSTRNSGQGGDGDYHNEVLAYLRRSSGELSFDVSRSRTAETAFQSSSILSKSSLSIDGSNVVRLKRYSQFGTEQNKSFSVARVSGSALAELRFLEGAFNETATRPGQGTFSHTGGVEYRTSFYASAPANTYVSELSSVNLSTDSFYTSLDPVSFDSTGFSCNTAADLVLSIDLTAPAFAPIQALCEGTRLEHMDFCRNSDISNASNQFFTSCN